MLNPEALKCHEMKTSSHWRHMYNKEKQWIIKFFICENINIFGYLRGRASIIIRLGPSWFTYTLFLIIIYMSNIEAI